MRLKIQKNDTCVFSGFQVFAWYVLGLKIQKNDRQLKTLHNVAID